jgi:hypothetical protein
VVLRQTQASIRPTKAKAIRERNVHLMLLGNFGDVVAVEVLRRVARIVQIQCRWHYALRKYSSAESNRIRLLLKCETYIADGQYRENRLDSTCSSQ